MPIPSRRGFVRNLLGGLWTGAALLEQSIFRANVARAQSQSKPNLPELFDIEKVADGVYAAIAKPLPLLNCNAAIFEQEKDLLLFDAHARPSAVVSLVSQIRRTISKKPVKYVVNSHFHWDHTQGTPGYRRIAPQASVISSVATRELLSSEAPKRAKQSIEQALAQLPDHRRRLASAVSPAEKAYWDLMVRDTEAYTTEMKSYQPELPNITFEKDLILHDKAHTLHLAWRGKGHTAGDVMVYSPEKKVVATGDLMHGFAPYIADGYPSMWPVTLRELARFDFDHLIGGHGGVQHSKQVVIQKANYIEELTARVRTASQSGQPVSQIQNAITPASLKSVTSGYGDFLIGSLSKFLLQVPGASGAAILEGAVRSNVADIHSRLNAA
ncbi:MAG: MBL fold metallo-hydrolase [Acidobacteria bacterium]|nr:MBL fold metallo-hydrolase [Acidobacteriota bacterium]